MLIGAGSIVPEAVIPYTTVVGNPGRRVGIRHSSMPTSTMNQALPPLDYAIQDEDYGVIVDRD